MTASARYHAGWVFADTSGYYAAAAEDEQRHAEALAILKRLEGERVRFYTTHYVLAELHALVVTRRRNPQLALSLLTGIESSATTIVTVNADDRARARQILAQHQDRL